VIRAKRDLIGADCQRQPRTGMPEPELVGIDLVPVRSLPGLQQEKDRRAARSAVFGGRSAPRLAIPAAFRVRLQAVKRDQPARVTRPISRDDLPAMP
jgi:hypothetical protein